MVLASGETDVLSEWPSADDIASRSVLNWPRDLERTDVIEAGSCDPEGFRYGRGQARSGENLAAAATMPLRR
jgi:hypothetical protein